ncbi:AimR family lysis-lysogeny pheromone receptor [Rossellomorea marisflavi]|uniref:AimR family lysis-lysogeny pheromone receptor n=1 Tax=Rossellomorea marisflavi TaxID=189381 RepID=UPI0025B1F30C|nr:AimR family lysis-lysogeny pheromone receptor [Rossellomorea marisflavi]WJV20756.1 AimR family lysis-lysogeny pheromone receptor [Rossellomorea marisflavi]
MGRLTLKQMILNKCEEERGLAGRLAELSGYNSGSSLMKILKDEKKEFAKFYGLVKIVRYLFPYEEKMLLAEYAATLDPKKQTARLMLEYLNINHLNEAQDDLISKMANCSNLESKEYAKVYEIDRQYVKGELSFNDAVVNFSSLQLKYTETKLIADIMKSYCYLDEHEYNMIFKTLSPVENLFSEIKDEYLSSVLYFRYAILMVGHYVRKQQIIKVRDICWSLINQSNDEYFVSFAYLHLGNSYMVESYDKSYNFLMRGYELVKDKHGRIEFGLRNSINFVSNLWKKDTVILDIKSENVSDVHEVAFYYIQHDQFGMGEKTLDTLNFNSLTLNQKAFHKYYRGILNNSMKDFTDSIKYFKQSGDFFYRQLPIMKLKEMNLPDCVLEALAE